MDGAACFAVLGWVFCHAFGEVVFGDWGMQNWREGQRCFGSRDRR